MRKMKTDAFDAAVAREYTIPLIQKIYKPLGKVSDCSKY
jgi:hypothetical protein